MKFLKDTINWIRASRQYKKKKLKCNGLPVRIWVEPTNFCNLKCGACPQKDIDIKQRGLMDFKLFKKIIDDASEFVGSANLFLRGEPLMHPRIVDMVRYTNEKGLQSRIETNACLLTKEKSKGLLEAELDFISFSFDGYDKETYEKYRVNGNFENTLSNIITFLKLKKSMGKKKPYTLFQVIQLPEVKKTDKKTKKEFLSKLKGLPINNFRIIVPHRFGGKISEKQTGTLFAYTEKRTKLKYQPCPYPWTSMGIYWDGKVVPCCVDFMGEYVIGDANKESLREIWNSKKMRELRRRLVERNIDDIRLCAKCDFLYQDTFLGISRKNIKDFWQLVRENLHL